MPSVFMEKIGFGLAADDKKIENEVVVGTFSKALGSYGSFVSCSKKLFKIVVNSCSGLILFPALPPPVLGSIYASVKKIPKKTESRRILKKSYNLVLQSLKNEAFLILGDRLPILFPLSLINITNVKNFVIFSLKEVFTSKI